MNKPKCINCNKALYKLYIRASYKPYKPIKGFYYCVDCEKVHTFKEVE